MNTMATKAKLNDFDMITAVCVTYGRQKFLERAIHSFLTQDDKAVRCRELLILNTLPIQKLSFEHPNVRIINLPTRPPSLGEARNIAVAEATGGRIAIWDDDDVYLPHHLDTLSENWGQDDEWVWIDKRLCALVDAIVELGQGCHGGCFGFTKKAWKEAGGYPSLSFGEDVALVQRITKLPGKRILVGDAVPSFIYCWGNGAYHVSGGGPDKPDVPGAYARCEAALNRRLATGEEKTGNITLKPKCDEVDWVGLAGAFMAKSQKKTP